MHLVSIIKACVKQLCSALLLKAAQSFLKWHLSKNELRWLKCVLSLASFLKEDDGRRIHLADSA